MKIKSGKKEKIKRVDVYYCDRCNISSDTSRRMCPCPRGGCDAEVVAKRMITTITETLVLKEEIN